MKLRSLRLLLSTGTLAAALLVAGCGGGGHKATPVAFSQTTLQAATDGTSYSQTLTVTGGTAPYTWTVSSGSLPAGLTLSSSGVLSGTPTVSGTFTFSITVTDSSSPVQSVTAAYTLTVAAPPIVITAPSLPGGSVGVAYSQTLVATGGTPPYTWTLASGTLPAGLTLSSAGVLSGTPSAAGSFSFAFTVTDSGTPVQTATTATLNLTILPAPLTGTALLQGQYFFKMDLFADDIPDDVYHEYYVGSLTFDGAGNITAGEYDLADDFYDAHTGAVTGTYTIGNDGRGTMQLMFAGADTQTYSIAVGAATQGSAATRARLIETDAASDSEDTGFDYSAGFLQLQDPTAFIPATLAGTSVFGWSGDTEVENPEGSLPQQGGLALVGQIVTDNSGNITAPSAADIATNQTTDTNFALSGTVAADTTVVGSSTAFQSYGRALLFLTSVNYPNGQLPAQSVIYVIDANTAFVVSYPSNTYEPLFGGYMVKQTGTFSASSLNGAAIAHGASAALNSQAAYAGANTVELFGSSAAYVSRYSADGAGNLTTVTDANIAGSIISAQSNTLTYTVGANGRTTFSGAAAPILWLSGTNSGFAITQPPASLPTLLTLEPQATASYSTATLNGYFLLGTQDLASNFSALFSGEAQADGEGNVTGTLDFFTDNGAQSFASTALSQQGTIAIDGTGRAVFTGSYSLGGTTVGTENAVYYLTSPTSGVGIDVSNTDTVPAILTLEPGVPPGSSGGCVVARPRPRSSGIHPDC